MILCISRSIAGALQLFRHLIRIRVLESVSLVSEPDATVTVRPSFCASSSCLSMSSAPQVRNEFPPHSASNFFDASPPAPWMKYGLPST
jgi:hypothetical protein